MIKKEPKQEDIDEIFRLYYRPLCMYATSLLKGTNNVEDIVMECFIHLWDKLKTNAPILNTKSYLFISVRNACYDAHKRISSTPSFVDIENAKDTVDINDEEENSEWAAQLWTAIDTLPNRCREIFLMSKREQKTYEEIAKELHLSVKTVETQISKAYRILRGEIRKIYLFFFSLFS
ncbi:RNA polymerase sigma-70 factor [Prevotella cerevisiae]|uniref:RNA polymerase sigma-70 factor n=1 Tax=Segatella cerevisiae TaxID=2053716 RepID=A0ABT1C0K4_9BACT|nr:RNA polymerase sigma-70 factor [Segatella cerevisiae]MCO6026143.1 RNA polymerase sigma-70 factor [Segatella cerevisiae]